VRAPSNTVPAHSSGFSLIEVLAALVVVSLGMLGVIEAVSQTASNTAYLRDKTLAHWVAMNRLTEMRLDGQAPRVAKSSDEIEMAGRRWRWTTTVTQTPVQSMRRIDVSVRLADGDEASSLASVTGFYGSAIAAPGTTVVMWQGTVGGPDGTGDNEIPEPADRKKRPPADDQPTESPPVVDPGSSEEPVLPPPDPEAAT
jgi:general secretion pathway protein I